MTTKVKAGPVLDQLKACGDGLAAAGDLHAGALVHALHSHLTQVYTSPLEASAGTGGSSSDVRVIAAGLEGRHPGVEGVAKRCRIDIAAAIQKPIPAYEVDEVLDRGFPLDGTPGSRHRRMAAKIALLNSGLAARA